MKGVYRGILLSLVCLAPLGAGAQTYTYDSVGRVSTVVQPNGAKTIYYYDNADNRTVTQTATNGATTATPPANSPVIWVTQASNLYTLAQSIGYNVSSAGSYTFIVPAGVTIVGAANGSAIDTGTWPAGSTIALIVNGTVAGSGGKGGTGGCYDTSSTVQNPTAGDPGSDAISVHSAITITVNSGGAVNGGGGGGGGGGVYGTSNGHGGSAGTCGGGGGGGYPNGLGGPPYYSVGSGFTAGGTGANGTLSGGGAPGGGIPGGGGGGAGAAGGAGASASVAGAAGGAAGYAVRKNGYTAPVTNSGTVNGPVG